LFFSEEKLMSLKDPAVKRPSSARRTVIVGDALMRLFAPHVALRDETGRDKAAKMPSRRQWTILITEPERLSLNKLSRARYKRGETDDG
jgi:hypothetical protein